MLSDVKGFIDILLKLLALCQFLVHHEQYKWVVWLAHHGIDSIIPKLLSSEVSSMVSVIL